MHRRTIHADPSGVTVHAAVLAACSRFAERTAVVDTSLSPPRILSYAEYGSLVESAARGLLADGIRPGEVIAIYLSNCWEFAVTYHAATMAGAVPTLINPSYREREVRYQLEDSTAVALITDGPGIAEISLAGLPHLRRIYATRTASSGTQPFSGLLSSRPTSALPEQAGSTETILAALPYSSGTTGLPKGVMLTHSNLVTNAYQLLAPGEMATPRPEDVTLGCLPLYHIYGLNVVLNPSLMIGSTVILTPRFDPAALPRLLEQYDVTLLRCVPPMLNALCCAAEAGTFPKSTVRLAKCGAAPLAPELARRFTALTGIPVIQGYGMTEASPVTHLGFIEPKLYRPDLIGPPAAFTECRLVDEHGNDVPPGSPGELVMRGPQFMSGYWRAPEATAEALRDGWYFSGDMATCIPHNVDDVDDAVVFGIAAVGDQTAQPPPRREAGWALGPDDHRFHSTAGSPTPRTQAAEGFFAIVDRRKEMIKYKGFPVAPAEVESVLLEHPLVRDCGVVGRADPAAGEVPCAFIVLRDAALASTQTGNEIAGYVGERLSGYKQPREVRFVESIPRNPSGKILRRLLRDRL